LIAALAVDPFLYAALLIEMAVLISVPMLLPYGEQNRQGVLRYLIFQTLGMLFILFTGWMLAGIETGPADANLMIRSMVMLGLGFAFLLAIFPFYTWIPLLAEQVKPYISGFIFVVLPVGVLFFLLDFLNQFAWLHDLPIVFQTLRVAGTLMIATGGIMAAFQNHLGRILGYTVIANIGLAVIAIGLQKTTGLALFSAQLLPYIVAVWLWVYSLTVLNREGKRLFFTSGADGLHRYPFATIGLLLACFTLSGLPLLAIFPFRLSMLITLAQQSPLLAIWVLAGSLGLLVAAVRSLAALSEVREIKGWQIDEKPIEALFLTMGILFLLILGWFPQLFLSGLIDVIKAFNNMP
jgi:NADH-quinone oxidoreductase subunit N